MMEVMLRMTRLLGRNISQKAKSHKEGGKGYANHASLSPTP
jgi:hypothetical protein